MQEFHGALRLFITSGWLPCCAASCICMRVRTIVHISNIVIIFFGVLFVVQMARRKKL
jgi:hypothetical protein